MRLTEAIDLLIAKPTFHTRKFLKYLAAELADESLLLEMHSGKVNW